jgi:acyl transferase domain-containing protein
MIGHSVGELVAAAVAGALDLQDAIGVVHARARIMQESPPGAMLAVRLPAEEVVPLLPSGVEVAVFNGPSSIVVAGSEEAVGEAERRLNVNEVRCFRLRVSHGYHSSLMDAAAAEFADFMTAVPMRSPRVPIVSSVTGDWIAEPDLSDGQYWGRHIRQPARFDAGLARIAEAADGALVEVGPGRSLLFAARDAGLAADGRPLVATMLPASADGDDVSVLTGALATLWEAGAELDFGSWAGSVRGRRVVLPTYPFQRKRFWVDPPAPATRPAGRRPGPRRTDPDQWLYMPSWQTIASSRHDPGISVRPRTVPVVLVGDGGPLGRPLADALRARGHQVRSATGPDDLAAALTDECAVLFIDGVADIAKAALPAEVAADHPYSRLLAVAKLLAQRDSGRYDLITVTNGAFDVVGGEPIAPDRQLLAGISKVIPKELPHVACRVVDVDLTDPVGWIAAELAHETGARGSSAVVAYRRGRRWAQDVARLAVPEPAPGSGRLRFRGVYLITGGLGGIGLSLAGYLARRCQARLVLTGRSGVPDPAEWDDWLADHAPADPISRRIAGLRAITAHGGQVTAVTADAGDEAAMARAVRVARERFGRLDGVIHAAGLVGGGLIETRDARAVADVLWPKVAGVRSLFSAAGEEALDFFALFSSLSTVDPWDGTADYTAANSYLDGFAHWARRRGRTDVVAIDWTGWRGMTMGEAADQEDDEFSLSEAEGHAAFMQALTLGIPQVHVCAHDLAGAREPGRRPAVRPQPPAAAPDPKTSTRPEAPADETEAFVCDLYATLLGLDRVGSGDSFFDLGGDSLAALDLVSRIRKRYREQILLRDVFDGPTPRDLAARISSGAR